MVRQTSIEAYKRIKSEGLLSTRRLQVYEMLFVHGPMTQNECWDFIAVTMTQVSKQSVGPRFAELLERGVIQIVGKRECKLTGYNCLIWDVTDQLPVEPEKREGEMHRLRRENSELRRELAELQVRFDIAIRHVPDEPIQHEQKEMKF